MCRGVLYGCLSVHHVLTEARRGCLISLELELQMLLAIKCVLGMKPESFGITVSALFTISPDPPQGFLYILNFG